MSPDLHRIDSEIRYLKKITAEMEANGLIDKLPTYGTETNRERLAKDLARCENWKKHYEAKLRHDRIMSRWHLRKLDRLLFGRRRGNETLTFRPMKIDEILQDRQIVDIG